MNYRSIVGAFAALTTAALAWGGPAAPSTAAPGPTNGWGNVQFVGGTNSQFTALSVAPDGYAVASTDAISVPQDGCTACQHEFVRPPGGRWTASSGVPRTPQFDDASNGWGLVYRHPGGGIAPVVLVSNRPAGGTWSAGEELPGVTSGDLVLTSTGVPVVATAAQAGDGTYTLRLFTRSSSGWTVTSTRTTDGFPRVGAGPEGSVRAAWVRGKHEVVVASLLGDGTWDAARTVYTAPGVELSSPAWEGPRVLGAGGVHISQAPDGTWDTTPLRAGGAVASGGPNDLATVTWTAADGRVLAAQQLATGGWSEPAVLAERGDDPVATVDKRGNATVAWTTDLHYLYSQRPVNGSWSAPGRFPTPVADEPDLGYGAVAAVDGRGTLTVGGSGTQAGVRGLHTADLPAPTALTVTSIPVSRWSLTSSFRVGWQTTWDRADSHDVVYRVRAITRSTSSMRTLASRTKALSATLRGTGGRVYCVRTRAHLGSTVGPWSERSCTSTPLDDRALRASKDWRRAHGITATTKRGATLVSPRIRGTELGLLVRPSAGAGTIRVAIGGHRLGTYRLTKGQAGKPRVIPLGSLTKTRSGRLVIEVVSSGKPVRIDGIYAR